MLNYDQKNCYVYEADCESHMAIVTDSMMRTFPANPEKDLIVITIVERNNPTNVRDGQSFEGRARLNAWYEENVGYSPDADAKTPIPILELIDLVATMLLLLQNDVDTVS